MIRICAITLTLALVAPTIAQQAEQQKLLAKRAAEADAYRKIAETIKGLQINSETYVRDFVTESDVIESRLDEFIKGVRLGRPRYFEGGTCEVEAEVTVAKVVEQLKQLHARNYEGNRIVGTDFNSIERQIQKNIIKVVGLGAPRAEIPAGLPEVIEDALGPAPSGAPSRRYPAIWSSVSPQGKLMAAQAARRDAQRKLLERIMGVRITSETLVRDFVTENDSIRTEASGLVVGAYEVDTYYHDDELIVEVTMAVPTDQVIRTIKELHTRHYRGSQLTATDIERVSEKIRRKSFEATGMGVPRAKDRRAVAATAPADTIPSPDWMAQRVTATGHGTDPAMNTPQGKLKAMRAATADARRNLVEQINGLRVSSETFVRDFVTERDEIRTQIQSVIAGSIIESQEVDDEMATVTASIGGPDLWQILNAQLRVESNR